MKQLLELQRKGNDVPALKKQPKLPEVLAWYVDAFYDLSTCRPVGFGMGPIPWDAARRYADTNGVVDFERFWTLIRAVDGAYLEWSSKKPKQAKPDDRRSRSNRNRQ